jgi:hypothetical protein
MARCPNRQWVSSASTSFDDGQQLGARSVQRCRQTAAKNFGGPQRSRGGKKKRGNRRAPPKNGTYTGKTDQDAISAAFRKVHFHLKNRRVTLTVEPTVARGACVSAPVFTLGGTTASKKLSRNGTFSLTRTFLGNKIDKIHGRWVSSTVVEGYAIYHFHGQDLCSGGKFRVNFRARHR